MENTKVGESQKPGFYCGTSNIMLPVKNKAFLPEQYQDKSRLNYYATLLNSIEINSTFYKLPLPRTIEKWVCDVPETFRFTFKLSKSITHSKELHYDVADIRRFGQAVNASGDKKGCILIQFPQSIKVSLYQKVKKLLDDLQVIGRLSGWHLAIEFRDPSWYQDPVFQMLESYKASIVMHDMPKSFTPIIDMERTFFYLRFHGVAGDYRGGYPQDFLSDHASNIQSWLDDGYPAFAYFNNTIGDAIHNAMDLKCFVD